MNNNNLTSNSKCLYISCKVIVVDHKFRGSDFTIVTIFVYPKQCTLHYLFE